MKLSNMWCKLFGKETDNSKEAVKGDVEAKLETYTVPMNAVEVKGAHEVPDKFNTFDVIIDKGNGVKSRVSSEKSHEVFRINGVGHTYEYDSIPFIDFSDAVKEAVRSVFYNFEYLSHEERYLFVKRAFVTDNGNYFIQSIWSDGVTSKYYPIALSEVQKLMTKCESEDETMKEIWRTSCLGAAHCCIKGGTVICDNKEKMVGCVDYYTDNEVIESFKVIDMERYSNIIEEY